jgi:hypothetical protein
MANSAGKNSGFPHGFIPRRLMANSAGKKLWFPLGFIPRRLMARTQTLEALLAGDGGGED